MKVIILAAGKGTRMLPLTETIPKVLVEVNNKPFLHYVIERLKQAGFQEFGIIAGYMKEKIAQFLEKNNLKATIIEQQKQLGTGHAIMQVKDFVKEENFIVMGGDNLFSVEDLKTINKRDNFCYVVGKKIKEDFHKYGILKINPQNNHLIKIIEKPKEFVGDTINIGLYKFTAEIWEALDKIQLSERGEYELTDAINILAQKNKVKVLQLQDYWKDLGTIEDIKPMEEFLRNHDLQ